MQRIYLDHAATSFPKAPGTAQAMADYLTKNGCNIGRSSYQSAAEAEDFVLETRSLLAKMFGAYKESHVIFTPGITHSLNCVIKGLLKPGDHCIISGYEHNAVMRPLHHLGVSWDVAKLGADGQWDDIESLFQPNTRLVVMTHASNVFGGVLPLSQVGDLCAQHGIPFVVDCAQTAGHLPVTMEQLGCWALCFAGHKGLLGPQGIGGMVLSPQMAQILPPFIDGGTGSVSHLLDMPTALPDRFEAGTLNIPGIVGLGHAVHWIMNQGIETIQHREQMLTQRFLQGLSHIAGVHAVAIPGVTQVGVVSVVVEGIDLAEAAWQLENFGIQVRCGLHCAPLAHQTMGTFPQGTVRFSFSFSNQLDEIDQALKAVQEIAQKAVC